MSGKLSHLVLYTVQIHIKYMPIVCFSVKESAEAIVVFEKYDEMMKHLEE